MQASTHIAPHALVFRITLGYLRIMGRRPLLLALALLAALAQHTATGCSDMLLADPSVSPAVVGFRNLDFPPMAEASACSSCIVHEARDLPFTFTQAVVPAGTEMMYMPPEGCQPSGFLGEASKLGFTCTTFWPEYLTASVAQECGGQYNTSVGLCLDGMNEKGLAVASLGVFQPVDAQYSYPNTTDKASSLPALSSFDVAGYMLANFASLEEVEQAMVPGKLQIVDDQGTALNIPLHWAVSDASGAYGVLELVGPEDWKASVLVVRNPDKVATNWPIPLSQADAARWKAQQIEQHGELNGPWDGGKERQRPANPAAAFPCPLLKLFEPGFCQVSDPGAAARSQGQISDDPCDVITRYTVLAMLKASWDDKALIVLNRPGCTARNATFLPDAFPDRGPYSPANSPDPTHPVIMQGIRIIDRVAIPGSWPNNTLTLPTDMTEIQYIRDHLNTTIYMRTAGTPRWVKISIPAALKAAEAAGGGPRFTPVAVLAPPDEPWALDISSTAGVGSASS
ncbi:hypothetical protein COHA_009912 [Chlorella ohadii]|uniref:Choloylglycine hydrolase/NAAA C-terminal domain-containing protein n=1 Tax=Chlorella ohadii TaxID=2649997 RepID=A0AAD5DDQ4_9CHLO|nr:hypothetical protein COHA_009912 [Chlorella ohadii]